MEGDMKDDKKPYDRKHMVEVLDTIMLKWHDNPYLRLGQLLVNATGVNDIFYVEDHILVNKVRGFQRADKDSVPTQPKDESGEDSSSVSTRSIGAIPDAVREFVAELKRGRTRDKR